MILIDLNSRLVPELVTLNLKVLKDPRFAEWPASPKKHHSYDGGLVVHTAEVALIAREMSDIKRSQPLINWPVLLTAIIWHDYGKVWTYERNPLYLPNHTPGCGDTPEIMEKVKWPWRHAERSRLERHLPRSYAEFMMAVDQSLRILPVDMDYDFLESCVDPIAHCILAHHGRLEYGSPVEPQTPEAWAIHLADMTSVLVIAGAKTT